MFRINTNIASINGRRQLFKTNLDVTQALERLSSGLRINRAADDAAGLSASEGMRGQIAAARQANKNISQAVALIQTADGGLEQIGSMLIRLKELAEQAADGSLNPANRNSISLEAAQLVAEMERIAEATTFNGMTMINSTGGAAGANVTSFSFYVGDGTRATNQIIDVRLRGMNFAATGIGSIGDDNFQFSVTSLTVITQAADLVLIAQNAINSLAAIRTEYGAFQNRLERAQLNIQSMLENTSTAESVIRDADFADETAALTRAQILVQAGASVLSQANLLPQNALILLQG